MAVAEVGADSATTPPSVSIPRTIELKMPEVAELSLTLRGVKLNPSQKFQPAQFERPSLEQLQDMRYTIRDIRSLMGPVDNRFAAQDSARETAGPVIEVEGPPVRRGTVRLADPDPSPTRPISRRSTFGDVEAPRIPSREESSRLWETPLPSPPERAGFEPTVPGAMREG